MAEPLRYDMILPNGEPLRYDMGPEFIWDGFVPANLYPTTAMQQNAISITITTAAEAAIIAKCDELLALVDVFAISIDDNTRNGLFKLGDGRLAFDEKCDTYLHQNPGLVPPGLSLTEYDKDGAALAAVKRIIAKTNTIGVRLNDTQIVLGSDRINADLTFYNFLEFAMRVGTAGADDIHADLKESFPGRNPGGGTPPPTPPTP